MKLALDQYLNGDFVVKSNLILTGELLSAPDRTCR
jgi:hypothetical protein